MAECALGVSIVKSKTAGRFNWPRFLKSSAIRKKHVNVNHIVAAETYVPIITKASKEMDNRDTFCARPSETIEKRGVENAR